MTLTTRILIAMAAGILFGSLLNLVANAGEVGAYLQSGLTDALSEHAHVGDIRGEGMLCAIEFVADKDNRTFFDPEKKIGPQLSAALLGHGVIARAMPQGDILGFAPPMCLAKAEADVIVSKVSQAVTEVLG